MISNFIVRAKRDRLLKERDALFKKMEDLRAVIASTGFTKQSAWKARNGHLFGFDKEALQTREDASKELTEINKQAIAIKEQLRKCDSEEEAGKNMTIISILEEIFTSEQMIQVKQEAESRNAGNEPVPMPFTVKNYELYKGQHYKYRQLAKDQLEKMIEFRILLTGLIEKGCDKFGQAEFLKFISPLNKLIIPVKELQQIKVKNNL